MIRWPFEFTRLVIIIAVVALLRWGLGPVANYVTIRGLEGVTGAKVEIAKTRVGLFPPRVQYLDVRIAEGDSRHASLGVPPETSQLEDALFDPLPVHQEAGLGFRPRGGQGGPQPTRQQSRGQNGPAHGTSHGWTSFRLRGATG